MKAIRRMTFFTSFPLGFISLVFPIYAASFGARGMEIGLLYSIFSIIAITMRPMVGRLIDNKGRKIGILLGLILYLLANFTFFIAKDLNSLYFARIVQSFGASFLWLSIHTYIADVSDIKNRSTNYATNEQILARGGFIGSLIGFNILLNNFGSDPFKTIFIVFTITSLLALYFGFKDIIEKDSKAISNDNIKVKRHKIYNQFLTLIFIKSLIVSLTAPIFLLYLQDYITKDLVQITFIFVPATILSMFLPRVFGKIADKSGRERLIFIGFFLIALLQIFIPFARTYNSFILLYTIISLVDMLHGPAYSSLIIDFVGEDKRGRSYGLYSLASSLGTVGGPVLGGFIYENIGNHVVFYMKGVLLFALTFFVCYIYYKHIKSGKSIEKLLG